MSREMPNAVSLEQSVLGSLMVYPKVIQDCQELDLHAEEFYLPSHQQIYQAICTIHENGQPIDMNTVVNRLQETDQLESSQGADYIIRLADSAISSATSRSYIETIKNKAQLRRLIYVADKISEEGYSSGEDIDTVLDDAERLVMDVTRHRRGSEFESSEEIVTRVINELKELRTMKGVTGIETGYVLLDRMTNGFQRGDLIILAARPAMGKSALALNFAAQVAKRNEGAVAIFSLEMPSDSMMKRLMSSESQVYSDKLRSGKLTNEEINNYLQGCGASKLSNTLLEQCDGSLKKALTIGDKAQDYETVEKIINNLDKVDIAKVWNSADLLYKSQDEILDFLDYINVVLYNKLIEKDKMAYINSINVVEQTKKNLLANANYNMCIDNLLLKLWEEFNEQNNRG